MAPLSLEIKCVEVPRVEGLECRVLMSAAPQSLTIALAGSSLQYIEKQGVAYLDPGLILLDANDATIGSASILLSGFKTAEDTLSATPVGGISASWNGASGELLLTGPGDVEDYQAALRSVTFIDASYDPATTPRTAQIIVTDTQWNEAIASRSIVITAVNDPPGVRTPPPQTTDTETSLVFSNAGGNAIAIDDVDGNGLPEQVAVIATGGTLRLSNAAAFTVSRTDSAIALFGPLPSINAALDGLTFTPNSDYAATGSIEVSADDLGNNGIGGAQIVNALIPINITGPAAIPPLVNQTGPSQRVSVSDPSPNTPPLPTVVSGPTPPNKTPVEPVRMTVESNGPSSPSPTIAAQIWIGRNGAGAVAAVSDGGNIVEPQLDGSMPPTSAAAAGSPESLPLNAVSNVSRATGQPYSAPGLGRRQARLGQPADLLSEIKFATVASATFSSTLLGRAHGAVFFRAYSRLLRSKRQDGWGQSRASLLADPQTAGNFEAVRARLISNVPLRVWAGGASVLSAGVSIAYLLWMARGGSVLSGAFSTIPPWQMLDPLPVLDGSGAASTLLRDEREGLEELIRDAAGT